MNKVIIRCFKYLILFFYDVFMKKFYIVYVVIEFYFGFGD